MLPVTVMNDAPALRRWLKKAFDAVLTLPPKAPKKTAAKKSTATKKPAKKR